MVDTEDLKSKDTAEQPEQVCLSLCAKTNCGRHKRSRPTANIDLKIFAPGTL